MHTWFKEVLPVKKKLRLAWYVQSAGMLGLLVVEALGGRFLPSRMAIGVQATIVVAVAAVILVMHRALANPYVATVVRMEALAAGDLASPIRFTGHRDCVGRMTQAMDSFREAARARATAEEQAATLRLTLAEERTRLDMERADLAAQQQTVMDSLADGLSRFAGGDLTCNLKEPFLAGYERLRLDFNRAVDQSRTALQAVMVNMDAIRSGAGEIAQASDDLSHRTEQQAASLEQTAAALDQITATVKRTAENSAQARVAVHAAKQDAEHTSDVVRDAVAAMDKIDDSSHRIGQIIGVIDDMAFQTNLLALNAGVEAARAGDAGRGFAVVASEVRALAQRSAQASKEIKALIYAADGQVKAGVTLVGEAGAALSRIIQQVGDINALVIEIAGSANEQATGLVQINTAVNQMDQVTQQNAAMVEQSTAAAHGLTQETEELARLVLRFQVGGAAVVQTPSAEIPAKAARLRRGTLKLVGSGRRVAPSVDGWEEF